MVKKGWQEGELEFGRKDTCGRMALSMSLVASFPSAMRKSMDPLSSLVRSFLEKRAFFNRMRTTQCARHTSCRPKPHPRTTLHIKP